jgi:hypothetical protein
LCPRLDAVEERTAVSRAVDVTFRRPNRVSPLVTGGQHDHAAQFMVGTARKGWRDDFTMIDVDNEMTYNIS